MKLKSLTITLLAILCVNTHPLYADSTSEEIGDYLQYLLPAAGLMGTYIADDKEGRIQWLQTTASSIGTTTVLKFAFGKMRPGNDSRSSFPSGHTTAAFAGAGFIDARYGHAWGALAYAGAAFTGYSRIAADRHFVDDVIAGMSVGLFNTWLWVTPQKTSLALMPMAVNDGIGVVASYNGSTEDTSEPSGNAQLKYSASFGAAFLEKNILQTDKDENSFNLDDFDKRDDPMTSAEIQLEYILDSKQTISFYFWPFESRDTKTLDSLISLNGVVFPENASVSSEYRHYKFDTMYSYTIWDNKNFLGSIGLGVSAQWTDIELTTDDGKIQSEVDNLMFLPFIDVRLAYSFSEDLSVNAELSGIYLGDYNTMYGALELQYAINAYWDIAGGIGRYSRDIDDEDLSEDSAFNLAFIRLGYSFY